MASIRNFLRFANASVGEAWQADIYDAFGYNLIALNPKTGRMERVGDIAKTYRYADPIHHTTDGSVLMIVTPVTRWRLSGVNAVFTKESPDDRDKDGDPIKIEGGPKDGQPIMTEVERTKTKTRKEWEAFGFPSDIADTVSRR